MSLDKRRLIQFLQAVDEVLEEDITLVAVGGTALTLLDLKPSTRDVDFTGPGPSVHAFREALDQLPHGFKVDTWWDGYVFTTRLPADYTERARELDTQEDLVALRLLVLDPVDLVLTKVDRLDERDLEDIRTTVAAFEVTEGALRERASHLEHVANEENFAYHLELVLKELNR